MIETDKDEGSVTESAEASSNRRRTQSRRGVIIGGAAVVPIVTLASRPALASRCTISGWASLNPSMMNGRLECKGRSHGYWKTHDWAGTGFHPGPRNPKKNGEGPTAYDILSDSELKKLGWGEYKIRAYQMEVSAATLYHEAIGVLTPTYYKGRPMTLMQALHAGDEEQREFGNAVLNAAKWGKDYGYTLDEMRDLIAQRGSDPEFVADLKTLYDRPADA
jgi:hypothetical protein